MSELPILRFGNPVLRDKSKRVTTISNSVQKLIDDMIDTMQKAYGAGLAAPQIGKLLRIITIEMPEEEPFALINPEIVKKTGEQICTEGCLSLPGYRTEMKRSQAITCKGLDRQGKAIRIKATDLLAQVLEHEIDHLNGILYTDYLESEDQLEKIDPSEHAEL